MTDDTARPAAPAAPIPNLARNLRDSLAARRPAAPAIPGAARADAYKAADEAFDVTWALCGINDAVRAAVDAALAAALPHLAQAAPASDEPEHDELATYN